MNEFVETLLGLTWHEPDRRTTSSHGGGGHGLATAYYLAPVRDHERGVIERDYIGYWQLRAQHHHHPAKTTAAGVDQVLRHSQRLYQTLEAETGCWIMHAPKGLMWLAHTETAIGPEARQVPAQPGARGGDRAHRPPRRRRWCRRSTCPAAAGIDPRGLVPRARFTARHDRSGWAYAQGAMELGVPCCSAQRSRLMRDGAWHGAGRAHSDGRRVPGIVMSAVGGDVNPRGGHAEVRLPIHTHLLQAFVTNAYPAARPIVSSSELMCTCRRPPRGQLLIGHEYERQTSYTRQQGARSSSCRAARPRSPTCCPSCATCACCGSGPASATCRPTSPPSWASPCRRVRDHDGLGDVGVQGHPGRRRAEAELIATGRTPELIAPFSLGPVRGRARHADQGSTGTR